MQDLLQPIQNSLRQLVGKTDLQQTATNFWQTLGYKSNKVIALSWTDIQAQTPSPTQAEQEAMPAVQEACMVFQVTEAEMSAKVSMFATNAYDKNEYQSYLFLACRLQDRDYKRETLATLTRLINKPFGMPVVVLFVYAGKASIGLINRRLSKKDDRKDVLEKVTLLKDIDATQAHRAQLDILHDLSLPALQTEHKVKNFIDLHQAWQKVLDTKELNKRFFKEIANWYFWAVAQARFPALSNQTQEQANQIAIIRLLTRLIFVWFIKEKGLVKEELFNFEKVQGYLSDFEEWKRFFEAEYQLKLSEKDKTQYFHSQYYKAVLQNVFFASLNADVKREEKHFIKNCTKQRKDSSHSAGAVYRYRYFFKDETKALQDLFIDIPFLNGGLFDALEQGHTKIDGFTNPIENQGLLHLPDALFFGAESADFSDELKKIYDIKDKKTAYKVQGIVHILKKYKFTIQENTPLEEDVALDPELLGQVFENLLAYYNPETGATARKGTGSFYTPREIVDYMVEESLKAYLKIDSLEALQQASPTEKEACIRQLAHIKILDPACGSGAFPMGVLHKIVEILKGIDQDNKIWRKIQKERAQAEIDLAYDIKEREERQKRLNEIDEIFENNLEDYGRKLFIIQNCIYGVDIQNIAIQISKLRFFLSLVIEQTEQGIKPLPNLETKFVCANTLIALDKPKGQAKLQNPNIEKKEAEIQRLRAQYFRIRSRQEKKKLIAQDEALRQELADLLQGDGWGKASAQKVAGFDLFDQNASADWFDADMMFGVKEGFDVVLGNPPYVNVERIDEKTKKILFEQYETCKGRTDLYIAFIEGLLKKLTTKGILSFIIPYAFINQNYGSLLRKMLIEKYFIREIVDTSNYLVFESANVKNIILSVSVEQQQNTRIRLVESSEDFKKSLFQEHFVQQGLFLNLKEYRLETKPFEQLLEIKDRIWATSIPLEKICFIAYGARLNHKTKDLGKAFYIHEKEKQGFKPFTEGECIDRYTFKQYGWLDYKPTEHYNSMFPELFENEKIMFINVVKDKLRFAYDDAHFYNSHTVINCVKYDLIHKVDYVSVKRAMKEVDISIAKNYKYKFLLAVLNSKVINWYFVNFLSESLHFYPEDAKNLPIPHISPEAQKPFEMLVEYILWLKVHEDLPANEYVNNVHIAGQFEGVLDAMVFELYFVESVKAHDADVLRYIEPSQGFVPILPTMTDEEKRVTIGAVYEAYRQKEHIVRNNVILQKWVEEIQTIYKTFYKTT